MGIYDREYYREDTRRGISLGGDRMMVTNLVLITVLLYVVDIFSEPVPGRQLRWLDYLLACHTDTLTQPWMWWRFLTYGFAHDPTVLMHVAANMFVLWMFGRFVEMKYGRAEFLRFYLVAIVLSGVAWAVVEQLQAPGRSASLIGASGGVTAVLILFVFNYPKQTLLLFFVLPVPAWLVGVLVIVGDMAGATGHRSDSNVAFVAHLAGAAFAAAYFHFGLNLGRLLPSRLSLPRLRSSPRLRVHRPQRIEDSFNDEVDRILDKIHREGESSLTKKERRTLEDASRRYQNRPH